MMNQGSGLETSNRTSLSSFATGVCLPALLRAQNADGGWGYKVGAASRVEPTSWSVVAAGKVDDPETQNAARRGRKWLLAAQQGDGLWTPHPGLQGGSWVTASACLALLDGPEFNGAVKRGAEALCRFQPRERSLGGRIRGLIYRKRVVGQDFSLSGWSWILGTSSWVIPTSLALILLTKLDSNLRPPQASERIAMANEMLLDRACPGGGWNCGNPKVYGVDGQALHEPTGWALIALLPMGASNGTKKAVEWLVSTRQQTRGAISLALSGLSLGLYGEDNSVLLERLEFAWNGAQFLGNVCSIALAAVALLPGADVLRRKEAR